jgi:nitroreductase
MLKDLILRNRSYRRFKTDKEISEDLLIALIELARFSASAGNKQAVRFMPVTAPESREKVFKCLSWAGYLNYWQGPETNEKPVAYIIFLTREERSSLFIDIGIYAQSILLGAADNHLGGCMFGSINREKLRTELNIPAEFNIPLVIALGYPDETIVLEDTRDDIKYWRDENDVHHVPKRVMEDLLFYPEE